MSDFFFAVPVLDSMSASDRRLLLAIADFAAELLPTLDQLTTRDWLKASMRLSDIESELSPLLAEYRQRYPTRSEDDPAPRPRQAQPGRDPFDADARTVAGIMPDDPDSYPLIAFL